MHKSYLFYSLFTHLSFLKNVLYLYKLNSIGLILNKKNEKN